MQWLKENDKRAKNNYPQRTTQKTKYFVTRTPLKQLVN